MPRIHKPRDWEIPESQATSETHYLRRRDFLKTLGAGGIGALGLLAGCARAGQGDRDDPESVIRMPPPSPTTPLYPAARNPAYELDRPLTDPLVAATYINFYEFSTRKDRVWQLVDAFETRPWEIEIAGLVHEPRTIGVDDLVKAMRLEERLYRHRCVEAWAMAVPWTGFPMRDFVDWCKPLASARHVRMLTFLRPEQAPGQKRDRHYPWPYYEGLTMDEATNELAMIATGIYGHELPKQHGAPIRLVVPWKYGFKSIKSIVRFEFTEERPPNFWNTVAPDEYDFFANVDPTVPHPRWSQASERMIGTDETRPTLPYNGYGEQVAHLYS